MSTGSVALSPFVFFSMDYNLLPDEEIVRLLQQGAGWAMAVLYYRYSPLVFSLALHILHDSNAAEETVQDVFVKVWYRAGDYDMERGRLVSWVSRIAHNDAIDAMRRRMRTPTMDLELVRDIPDESATPHEIVVQQSEQRRVHAALDRISDEQRRAIELAFFQGMSHPEIAEQLGLPMGTVKTRIRRGMQKLKIILQEN